MCDNTACYGFKKPAGHCNHMTCKVCGKSVTRGSLYAQSNLIRGTTYKGHRVMVSLANRHAYYSHDVEENGIARVITMADLPKKFAPMPNQGELMESAAAQQTGREVALALEERKGAQMSRLQTILTDMEAHDDRTRCVQMGWNDSTHGCKRTRGFRGHIHFWGYGPDVRLPHICVNAKRMRVLEGQTEHEVAQFVAHELAHHLERGAPHGSKRFKAAMNGLWSAWRLRNSQSG